MLHGTDAELTKIEQVQTRVLRRLAAARENLADDLLRCELACRHTASWQQHKLEFAFELQRMPPGSRPAPLSPPQPAPGKRVVVPFLTHFAT